MRHVIVVGLASAAAAAAAASAAACGEDRGSEAPRRSAKPVATSVCSPMTYGGRGRPTALIVNVGPLQGSLKDHGVQNAQAVKLVLAQRGWRAGRHTVGLQVCDEASAQSPLPTKGKCIRTARTLARNSSVVAVIGPVTSLCAAHMLPVLNEAPGGPVPTVSMSNTYLGLTRSGPGVAAGEPARYYPSGRRHYVRVAPPDDTQGAAGAVFARRLGVRRPVALHDGEPYGAGLAAAFTTAARRLGMDVGEALEWDPRARDYARLAERVRRAGADGVYVGGYVTNNGPRLVRDLGARLGRGRPILAGDGFNPAATIVEGAGAAAEGMTLTIPALPNRALPPQGRRFAAQFERRFGQRPCCFAVHAAEATGVVLDALARSDGSRDGVTANLFRGGVRNGLLGRFEIDRHGDTSLNTQAVYRIERGRLRFVTAITPPADLLARR